MRAFFPLLTFTLLATGAALAQETPAAGLPAAELFVGYSHLGADVYGYGFGEGRKSAPGWRGGLSAPMLPRLSIDVEGTGNYRKTGLLLSEDPTRETMDVVVGEYTVFVGPRVNFGPVFIRAMFGGDYIHYKTPEAWVVESSSGSEWSAAGSFGGGVKLPVTRLVSFQAGLDYEVARHDIFGTPPAVSGGGQNVRYRVLTQNNFRVSAGVVFNVFKR
ncbi:MAG: hypothetical protein LBT74_08300 [Acidobacteriota bacterium]|jgi:hypothetical protein|nr:hypothetical protein [Acidobacteriota bacterium]